MTVREVKNGIEISNIGFEIAHRQALSKIPHLGVSELDTQNFPLPDLKYPWPTEGEASLLILCELGQDQGDKGYAQLLKNAIWKI